MTRDDVVAAILVALDATVAKAGILHIAECRGIQITTVSLRFKETPL